MNDRPNCYSRVRGPVARVASARAADKRKKKSHPAELAAEQAMVDAIRGANHFLASLFVGRGEYQVRSARNIKEALSTALLLESAFPTTRKCIIYAVSAETGGHVTMLTYGAIDKLLAMIELPKGFEIVAGKHKGMLTLMRGPTEMAVSGQRADLIEIARGVARRSNIRSRALNGWPRRFGGRRDGE